MWVFLKASVDIKAKSCRTAEESRHKHLKVRGIYWQRDSHKNKNTHRQTKVNEIIRSMSICQWCQLILWKQATWGYHIVGDGWIGVYCVQLPPSPSQSQWQPRFQTQDRRFNGLRTNGRTKPFIESQVRD